VANYLHIALIEFNFLKFRIEFLGAVQNCENRFLVFPRHVYLSVRVSAWNNAASTRIIFMKFDIRKFYENKSKRLQFH